MKKTLWKAVLPVVVLIVAVGGTIMMIRARPEPKTRTPEVSAPLVRVVEAKKETVRLEVSSQGTVAPRTETSLVPEVAGRAVAVSTSMADGEFFEQGETLVALDPTDYENGVIRARAAVAQAEVRLAREQAEARVAREEWRDLRGSEEASPLTTRELQVAEARAALDAARAELKVAEQNLERTRIRAPYAGRVREKNVDVGQFVSPGQVVARIYAVDYAEVRLPVPDEDLAFFDVPLQYREASRGDEAARVLLEARFAGGEHTWQGRIVRTEGEIDPRSRMVHVVAQVDNPYGMKGRPDRPPLSVGMFVDATILGHEVDGVFVLPRAALRGGSRVWVVDSDERLRFRDVEVLRAGREDVVIRSGLDGGERVCLSPLSTVTDGMKVRVHEDGEAS